MAGDDGARSRRPDYRLARIGVSAALTVVVVVLLLADVVPALSYEPSPVVLFGLLGTIVTLLGLEARSIIGGQ